MRIATFGATLIVLGMSFPAVAQPVAPVAAPQLLPPAPGASEMLPAPTPLPQGPGGSVPEITDPSAIGFTDAVTTVELPGRFWTSAEYLLWRTSAPHLNFPLETASQSTFSSTGAVKSPYTFNFFGPSNLSYKNYSGARLATGYWLNPQETLGIEGTFFFIESPGVNFFSPATATAPSIPTPGIPGLPITIFRPYISAITGAPTSLVIGNQTGSTGFVAVNSGSSLYGAEANLVWTMYNGTNCHFELVGGYRYLNLTETLNVLSGSNAMGSSSAAASGAPFFVVSDRFQTLNDFQGGQIGGRFGWNIDHFAVTLTTKVAVGANMETLNVGGVTAAISGVGVAYTPGGFLALPSNSGRFTHDDFSVVPQVGLTLGYLAGQHCRFYVGYDFLFWTEVARPGEEINPVINPIQVPSSPYYVPGATVSQPQTVFLTRGFWAQGFNCGLEVRY